MNGRGPGPSPLECVFLAGHAAVSTDAGLPISGFNPNAGGIPAWQVMQGLTGGEAFPGIVTDVTADTARPADHRASSSPLVSCRTG